MKNISKIKNKKLEEDGLEVDALSGMQVDALFSFVKEKEIPMPSRADFKALLSRIPTKNIVSPYAPIINTFMTLRFVTPLALGLLIVVSGIGIETGRISFEASNTANFSKEGIVDTSMMIYPELAPLEQQDTAVALVMAIHETVLLEQEEDYDEYIASENETFTSLAEAYEVTI